VRRVYAQRREIIFHEGDPCTGLHFVVYGRIKISLQSWKGADKPISLVGPGGFFGDITMFLQDPYYRKVQALDDTLLLYLPLRTIKRMIEGDSRFALRLLGSLSEKVRGLVRDIESFSLQPPAARLVTYLMRLLPPKYVSSEQIELSISKSVIAAHLNLAPETLSRYFRELTDLGLVTVRGRTVLVHNVDELARFMAKMTGTGSERKERQGPANLDCADCASSPQGPQPTTRSVK